MEIDFNKIMSKRTDAELLEILEVKSNEYQLEALTAAKNELERRSLSTEETNLARQRIKEKDNKKMAQANSPLPKIKKQVIMNFILLYIYLCFYLGLDYYSVKIGQRHDPLNVLGGYVLKSFPIAIFIATWISLKHREKPYRFLFSIEKTLYFTILGVLLIILVGIPFHVFIGGSL